MVKIPYSILVDRTVDRIHFHHVSANIYQGLCRLCGKCCTHIQSEELSGDDDRLV
jgi:uncharacterized cysteine cluster protein YcgN (CxxCxxCC family)